MAADTISGIPRLDLEAPPVWKRKLAWWTGGRVVSKGRWRGLAQDRRTNRGPDHEGNRGGACDQCGRPRRGLDVGRCPQWQAQGDAARILHPDGDDVILIASNWGRERHPAWYHNLLAHPECELHIGPRGGSFVAREAESADRDRLYALAADRLNKGFALYEQRINGIRTIPIMRLSPAPE